MTIVSNFGKRGKKFHEGIDLRAQQGTPVYAAQSGRVLYADSGILGYGKMVVIQHSDELSTIYAHHSKLFVHRGQRVSQGQRIALSGKTGRVTGPHLHFEIRQGTIPMDPLELLSQHHRIKSAFLL